ncbi:hypothetical protein [Streptomyces sp. NPDC046887]|uniref:hypothetical protein n=1 Tax=Streptomyces sp. NPDC046887 TaxID=3155472 RepID=UPI00341023DE
MNAYLVELDVDEFGCLDGDESLFPKAASDHDWNTPYPSTGQTVPFTWESGEGAVRPDVFWYPQMLDWVCNERAYRALAGCSASDLNVISTGVLDGEPVYVVQASSVLDVVVREASVIDIYETYDALRFPAFRRDMHEALASRVFRVPGGITMVFVGGAVKEALDEAGVKGFRYVKVDWAAA